MLPLIVLVTSLLVFRTAGAVGVPLFAGWIPSLRAALAVMFFLTASAHWGKRRPDLVRMVPASFPNPGLLVTITGVLEIAGAIGLLIPATARIAASCLALLLISMFPANIRAARQGFTIGGKPVTKLPLRMVFQAVFIGALITAGWAQ